MTDTDILTAKALAGCGWLEDAALQRLFTTLEAGGGTVRAAGGAIRNALLGLPVADIDLATDLTPDQTMKVLRDAKIKVVPTGIDHGTVTAIVADRGRPKTYEITTLRVDVATDGRRAKVAFTDNWKVDAERRDFTVNALYCDRNGQIFDFVGGLDDLTERRVRFVGSATRRIREDYLRILRFFRFYAQFGDGEIDEAGLRACIAERTGLKQLSRERIRAELMKLLVAPGAHRALDLMQRGNILQYVLPQTIDLAAFCRFTEIERVVDRPPDWLLRLYVLVSLDDQSVEVASLRQSLKLSNSESKRLRSMVIRARELSPDINEHGRRTWLYHLGEETFRDSVLVAWAASGASPSDEGWQTLYRLPVRWQAPAFPITGQEVISQGVAKGPDVGQILRRLEAWWIDADFTADRARLDAKLHELITHHRRR